MPSLKVVLFLLFGFIQMGFSTYGHGKMSEKTETEKLTSRAIRLRESGDFEKSLLLSRWVLQKAIAIGDWVLVAKNYNNVAANYNDLVEVDKAIFYYNKALSYAQLSDNDSIKQKINNNLGNVYCFEKKKFEKGIQYYKAAIKHSQRIKDSTQFALTHLNICWVYFDLGKFNEGKNNLDIINSYYQRHPNDFTAVVLFMLNAMYADYNNETAKATSFFEKSLSLGVKNNQKSDLSFAHLEFSKFLLKRKDYKMAYEHLAAYTELNDEIYAEEKLKKADIAGINLELDEYKRTIDKIENEKNLQYQSLKKSRIIVLLFIIALTVLLLFLISLIKHNRLRLKSNSDLLLANEELLIANKRAEESAILKTQFVSTISHELRTPLYGVVGIADLLLEEHKELASSPHLNSLKFSARYLLSLVNDILQINKIDENKIVLEAFTFSLADEFQMIKDALSFIAQKKNNEICIDVDPLIPKMLIGDKLRFAQILMNLVSNALKFTEDGKVFMSARQLETRGDMHRIEVKIADNGIGIAAEDQEKIFDKFVQVGRKEVDYQGTGLGLAIVKKLLKLFNSDIMVVSELGKGTVFSFCIDFQYNEKKSREIINTIQVDVGVKQGYKVLVVEDNRINQLITKKIIEKHHYSAIVVDSGYKALEILDKEYFDIILMDINMPELNGFETSTLIREKGYSMPIIALTAFDKNEITERTKAAGINDIIVKPFEEVQLFTMINFLIQETKTLYCENKLD